MYLPSYSHLVSVTLCHPYIFIKIVFCTCYYSHYYCLLIIVAPGNNYITKTQMSQQNDSDYESEYEQPAQVYSNQCSWKFEDGKWVRTVEEKSEANLLQVCSDQSKECGWKFEDEKCVRRDAENSEFKKIDGAGACKGVGVLLFGTANKMLLAKGIGKSAQRAVSAKAVHCKKHVKDVFGIKILGARAEAKLGNAAAGASVTPIQGETFAKVSGVEASAHAYLIEGITEVNAKVVVAEVQTNAGAGIKSLGAEAGEKFDI